MPLLHGCAASLLRRSIVVGAGLIIDFESVSRRSPSELHSAFFNRYHNLIERLSSTKRLEIAKSSVAAETKPPAGRLYWYR